MNINSLSAKFSHLLRRVLPESTSTVYDDISDAVLLEIQKQSKLGRWTGGPPLHKFERAFAKHCGTRFAVGVNSGSDALLFALRALDIGPGDEVITAPNSYIATAAAIHNVGATVRFVDIGDDLNIDANQIAAAITKKTRVILPVHFGGYPCDMETIARLALENGVHIVEDAAQAFGATFSGKPVGSFGAFGCFSLHPLKDPAVWGDGGVITTSSEEYREKVRGLTNHGFDENDESRFFAYRSRLDTLQAIVGYQSLIYSTRHIAARQKLADIYFERLAGLDLQLPKHTDRRRGHVYSAFAIQSPRAKEIISYLRNKGVEADSWFPPIHLQKAGKVLGYQKGDFPKTENIYESLVMLPMHHHLDPQVIHRACDALIKFHRA